METDLASDGTQDRFYVFVLPRLSVLTSPHSHSLSTDIGRSITFLPDVIDQQPPPVVPELDFDEPMYRSSAFHWSAKLIFIGAKIMCSVYSLKPGVSLGIRQAPVPDLHLQLEKW